MEADFDRNLHVFTLPAIQGLVEQAIAFFQTTPVHSLPPRRFAGAGVYALYYIGDFPAYTHLAEINRVTFSRPIYVGKAVPRGWRTARSEKESADVLYARLRKHSRSIRQAQNLELKDFYCRFMILEEAVEDLIVPTEAELIRIYTPLWNSIIDGFGNNDPGRERYNQLLSEWDTFHPGRPWTTKWTGDRPSLDEITHKISDILDD